MHTYATYYGKRCPICKWSPPISSSHVTAYTVIGGICLVDFVIFCVWIIPYVYPVLYMISTVGIAMGC